MTFVNGIEITAVESDRDVHVLGYFCAEGHPALETFLDRQRADRRRRIAEIVSRLSALGFAIDADALLEKAADAGRSIGRPHVADALVAAGHAADRSDAFDRFIGAESPAFVPRRGATCAEVVRVINEAGGIASLAHPGLGRRDDLIPVLAAAGLAA